MFFKASSSTLGAGHFEVRWKTRESFSDLRQQPQHIVFLIAANTPHTLPSADAPREGPHAHAVAQEDE
ncbi:hypothetical protein NQZ68_040140 [Dissostichus eleginoides]|nr:hypothetical protein NQZ68_040140 [Dissostichus eleginoides]